MTRTCDTSVLVPALASWHDAHEVSRRALGDVRAVGAHVLLETYSVLTRLPGAQRLAPDLVARAIEALDWEVIELPTAERVPLIRHFAELGIAGGAVYDGLVAATAAHHDVTLLTRDSRARRCYDDLGIRYQFVV